MNNRFLASCLAGATGLALAACSERPMDIDRTFSMTPPIAHGTGAKTRLITTTVLPEYQRWGISLGLMGRLIPEVKKWGIEEGEFRDRAKLGLPPSPRSTLNSAATAWFSASGLRRMGCRRAKASNWLVRSAECLAARLISFRLENSGSVASRFAIAISA